MLSLFFYYTNLVTKLKGYKLALPCSHPRCPSDQRLFQPTGANLGIGLHLVGLPIWDLIKEEKRMDLKVAKEKERASVNGLIEGLNGR